MQRILLLCFLLILPLAIFGNGKLDSLYHELGKTVNDSIYVDLLLKISQTHSNYDSLLYYAHLGMEKSDSSKYLNQYAQLLNTSSIGFMRQGQFEKAVEYVDMFINIANQQENKIDLAKGYNNKGIFLKYLQRYNESLEASYKALLYHKEMKDTLSQAGTLNGIANVYAKQGKIEQEISTYEKALNLLGRSYENTNVASTVLMNLGNTYFYAEDYESALKFHKHSLDVAEKLKNPSKIISSLNALGGTLLRMDKDSLALTYLNRAIEVNQNVKVSTLGVSYNNIGLIYKKKKKSTKAINAFLKTLECWDLYPDRLFVPYLNIGDLYLEQNRPDSALHYLNKAENLSLSSKDARYKNNLYAAIAKAHYQSSNYKTAYDSYYKAQILSDSILNEEKIIALKALEVRYQTRQQRDSIKLLNTSNDLSQQRIARQRINIFALVFGILLLSSIVWLLNKYRREEKQKRLLKEDINKLLTDKAEELETANQGLAKTIEQQKIQLQTPEFFATKKIQLTSGNKPLIALGDILFIEAKNNLVEVTTATDTYREWQRLKNIKAILPEQLFVQVHKSYIVNVMHIESALPDRVAISNGKDIRVTRTYSSSLQSVLMSQKREI